MILRWSKKKVQVLLAVRHSQEKMPCQLVSGALGVDARYRSGEISRWTSGSRIETRESLLLLATVARFRQAIGRYREHH